MSTVALLMVTAFCVPAVGDEVVTRSATFCSLQMRYADLADIVSVLRESRLKANRDAPDKPAEETVALDSGPARLELSQDFSEAALSRGPEITNSVRYSFLQFNAPIREISLRFGDYSRELIVSGRDRAQVEGILRVASDRIDRLGCSFGGFDRRWQGALGLLVLATVLGMVATMPDSPLRNLRLKVALIASAALIYPAIFFLPWSDWLPGTVVRAGDLSFFARNAPLIGFAGTIASIAGLVFGVASLVQRRSREVNAGDDQAPPAQKQEGD